MSVQQVNATVLPFKPREPEAEPLSAPMVRQVPVFVVAVLVALFVVSVGLTIRSLRSPSAAQTRPEVGVVAVCAWSDRPNPSGLPICEERARSSS